MTLDDAAVLLGVEVGAPGAEVERAFRRRARAVHPDAAGGADDAFIALTAARDLLLAVPPPVIRLPPRRSLPLFVTWIALLPLTIAISASMAPQPFTLAEPIVRYTLLVGGLGGYALTGRRPFFVVAVIALAATALVAVLFTTFGALVGLLMMVAPVYGLVLIGRRRAQW